MKENFLKVTFGNQSYHDEYYNLDSVLDIMREAQVGDAYTFEIVELTREEFDAGPEFEGF